VAMPWAYAFRTYVWPSRKNRILTAGA
jgi:hypothetical protein